MAVNLSMSSYNLKWLFNKHGYLLFSVVFHLVLFYILSHLAVKPPVAKSLVDQRVKVSMNNTYKMKMHQSVKSIAQAQNELVNSLDESIKKNLQLEPVDAQAINDPKVTISKLMELANKISENIRKIERELRAQDLQRAVTMPRSDVMKRVMNMEIDLPQYRGNRIKGSTMMKLAEAMEKEAEDVLSHRKNDIKIRGYGNSTTDVKKAKAPPLAYYSEGDPNLIKGLDSSIASNTAQQGLHSKNDFVDLWLDHIPRVNRENPKKVAGRIIKSSGRPADRLFINSWYIIGPFADSSTKHPPEYAVDLEGVYYGKENHPVSWKYLSNSQYPLIPPQVDKAGVFFGYTEIIVEREQDFWVWIGADDFASLELNNQLIWDSTVFNKKFNALAYDKNNPERENWNLTEFKRKVHFNAGRNTFKFKLTNSDTAAFFSLVLTK
ncbi:hypothetical protein GCM10011613_14670 [Cellvibrio zantedeschiae]|uniref:PA14 domain-containing protein n=1 Tax=Cellvibrio zantedeschiae TaxID=1237077 RepID=A0ABQ3B0N3_9GAMM|nr:hypothetical protein [Cellvibrio zantedeschiae]GGY71152.1 hypothetical protein GCM10011613_14670 [Cellvibrio zantedeschiae]